ncbi:MAG: rubrerythrin [Candidatus Omnitrophica bacterium]|nr:rubrerythrin [Candidatus Omnitrophota bacterium]
MRFDDLDEPQLLALAIGAEEEDGRIYRDFAHQFRTDFPATAKLFDSMADEESGHRHRLITLFQKKFGEYIPLVRRQDVSGFMIRRLPPLVGTFRPEKAREQAAIMEFGARKFYEAASQKAKDASIKKLLGDLAQEEQRHGTIASDINEKQAAEGEVGIEETVARKLFVLRFVQPALAGLMDGSVSTLAPIFAAAFATSNTVQTFKVGLAASVGAGISMGFAEALSDDGKISGRGTPWLRGVVCGLMTALGGIGHTVPFLFPDFHLAMTIAIIVVVVELFIISIIRWRYMDTPFLSAAFQVIVGGLLVFLAGWWIGAG